MEAQVSLTVAFSSSALLGLVSHIPLDNTPIRFSMGFSGQASLLANQATVTPWFIDPAFGTFGSCGQVPSLLENEISISIKAYQEEGSIKCF